MSSILHPLLSICLYMQKNWVLGNLMLLLSMVQKPKILFIPMIRENIDWIASFVQEAAQSVALSLTVTIRYMLVQIYLWLQMSG